MRPDGTPFALRPGPDPDAPPEPFEISLAARPLGFADVFTAKGLFTAAVELGDSARADAVEYLLRRIQTPIKSFENPSICTILGPFVTYAFPGVGTFSG